MKKLSLILLILLAISPFAFSASYTGLGLSGLYNEPYQTGEMGLYTNFSYTFPVDNSPVSLGFGSRLDFSFSIPVSTLSLGFISGFAMNANLNQNLDLYIIIGPQVSVFIPEDDRTSLIGIGGGLDVGLTYYFNSEKTVGTSFGIINYFSACLPDDSDKATFGYYGGAYVGLTVKFASPFYSPLPVGFDYIDYIAL